MVKRWYFWLTVLVFLSALFTAIGLIYYSQGRINQANFDRLNHGMTEQQVIAILGEPSLGLAVGSGYLIWIDGPDAIMVSLDSDGRLETKSYTPPTLRRRLRWRVNEWLARIGLGEE
jgi:SmpA / OmlA family